MNNKGTFEPLDTKEMLAIDGGQKKTCNTPTLFVAKTIVNWVEKNIIKNH